MNKEIKEFRKKSIIKFVKKNIEWLERETAEPIAIAYEMWRKIFDIIPCSYNRFAKIYNSVKIGSKRK